MSQIGLIIGRFQPFHLGHKILIDTSVKENAASLVLVGSSNKIDAQNPYGYAQRKEILQQEYENKISLGVLHDFPSDQEWVDLILSYIPEQVSQINLYCGDKEKDSAVIALSHFQENLPFRLNIIEIPRSIIPISATQIRDWIQKKDTQNLKKYLSKKTLLSLGIQL